VIFDPGCVRKGKHISSYPGHSFVVISGIMLMHLATIMLIQVDGRRKNIFFVKFFLMRKLQKKDQQFFC
jgi:hypothetical protein